jgi:ABC-type branched-subunit amino acid transport system substrate-binding protein
MKRYAALYPKNPYGENAEKIFESQLSAAGGSLVVAISYDPNAVDFTKTAAALKAKDPSLSYDAIFIPDNYARVGLLAPALAFQELPVGHFRPHSSSTPIVLVGLNSWNNDEFPRRGGTYVVDSIFVDAFNPHLEDVVISDFVTSYKEKTGATPTLVEAVGYDTVRLVSSAVKDDEPDLEVALKAVQLADPIAGTQQVTNTREISRSYRMLTVEHGGIEPLPVWQPPSEPEGQ